MGITKNYLVPAAIFDEFVSKVYTRGNKQVTAVLKNPLEKYSLKESRNNASKKRKASDKSGEEPKEKVTSRKVVKKPALPKQTSSNGKNKKQNLESTQEDGQEENEQSRSITTSIESSNLEKPQSSSSQSSESDSESDSSATSSESD